MKRTRSLSLNESSFPEFFLETEEDALEKELSESIAARKSRETKEGYVYIQESSWLGICCGVFSTAWRRKYARLDSGKLCLSLSQDSNQFSHYSLKEASISLSDLIGHNGRHNCISISKNGRDFIVSLETADDLKDWMLSLNSIAINQEKSSDYFNL
jgi:PH domain